MKRCFILISFVSLFILLLFYGCKKIEPIPDQPIPIPDFETSNAEVYMDGGVTITGKINTLPKDLEQYGFILSTDSLLNKRAYHAVTDSPAIGIFKTDINTTIIKGKKYFYATYTSTQNEVYKVYNIRSFVATGSKKAKVSSISSLRANPGDTLFIKGKFFSGQELNLKLDEKPVNLFDLTDSTFKFIIPYTLTRANPLIILNGLFQTDTISDKFSLHAPVVKNFTEEATFGDVVTIEGNHFNDAVNDNEVYFGNIKGTIIESGRNRIKVIVPNNIEHSYTSISVKSHFQEVTSTTKFKITEPEITSFSPSGYIGDVVTIEGKYFSPVLHANKVFFDDNFAPLSNGNTTNFTLAVPPGAYPQKTATITVKLLDYVKTFTAKFKIKTLIEPSAGLDLYILAGQSNMSGRGYLTTELIAENSPFVFMLTKDNKWLEAKHPLHSENRAVDGVGPGLTFGIGMSNAKPGRLIGLIPCAVGGTGIQFWVPNTNYKRDIYPYDDAVARIKVAMQYGTIKGIIWHQGEANTSPDQVKKHLERLKKLIERLRAVAGNPNLPFIAGELGRYAPDYQRINAELHKLPGLVPNTAIVSSERLEDRGDRVHFNGESAQELGRRFAAKMLELQK